jgi:ATP-dependent Clp protease adaptor protein ClpS
VTTKTVLEPEIAQGTSPEKERLYHVIILNDEDHTIDYVVEMLQAVIKLSASAALACTMEADSSGSSIVYTGGLEEAENKRDLIHAYGPDWRMPHSRGPVSALVEPAAE